MPDHAGRGPTACGRCFECKAGQDCTAATRLRWGQPPNEHNAYSGVACTAAEYEDCACRSGRETTGRCPADDLIDGWHGKPPCTCYSIEDGDLDKQTDRAVVDEAAGRKTTPDHLPFGTYVEEGPDGYRVWFSQGEGHVEDVTDLRVKDRRYFVVAEEAPDA